MNETASTAYSVFVAHPVTRHTIAAIRATRAYDASAAVNMWLDLGFEVDVYAPSTSEELAHWGSRVRLLPVEYRASWLLQHGLSLRWRRYDALSGTCDLPMGLVGASASAGTAAPEILTDPMRFFEGRTEGVSTVKVIARKPFTSRTLGRGQIADGMLTLVQRVHEDDKAPFDRRWRMKQVGPGRFTGTMSEAVGPVVAEEVDGVLELEADDGGEAVPVGLQDARVVGLAQHDAARRGAGAVDVGQRGVHDLGTGGIGAGDAPEISHARGIVDRGSIEQRRKFGAYSFRAAHVAMRRHKTASVFRDLS